MMDKEIIENNKFLMSEIFELNKEKINDSLIVLVSNEHITDIKDFSIESILSALKNNSNENSDYSSGEDKSIVEIINENKEKIVENKILEERNSYVFTLFLIN